MERDLQDIKEEIRARTDIVEIIGQYTRLKRTGKNWTGLCPFHADKRPSFSVVPDLQIYKCFSCGEGGDLFKFVQKKENLEFIEAIEVLAKRAGIPFERRGFSKEKAGEREQMLEINQLAVRFFQDRLTKSQEAQTYLAGRAILKETQDKFDVGFAPPDWEGLTYYLQQHRVDMTVALKVGLIRSRQQEGRGYYDFYRNRLMFPIHDVNGNVVGFGGRAMGDETPKYLNSEDSVLFNKSRTLYGLYFARKKLSGEIPAVFVEGYVDVIATHQAGFTQCVATLGTSMTEDHARMLARYNPRAIICYDGDSAGIKATLRGAGVWESIGVEGAEIRVARMPAGDDPDSLLRRGETSAFQNALDSAILRVDYQMELALKQHDTQTEEGRDAALAEIIPILASVRSLSSRDRYAQRLAHLHPSYRYNIGRAIEQILADAATYSKQSKSGNAPRERGYPLSEATNRGPLSEQASAPVYHPANPQQHWPMTQSVAPKRQSYPSDRSSSSEGYGKSWEGKSGNGYRDKKRFEKGPIGDPTPPSLRPPTLSGTEKAERQLLRALFSPEWRLYILSRLHPAYLVTPYGRKLFELIARTPTSAEGTIEPYRILRLIEAEEEPEEETPEPTPLTEIEGIEDAEEIPFPLQAEPNFTARKASVKLSDFLREILEDSPFLVSNELLNEVSVSDCIRRLQKLREEQSKRDLAETLQRTDLTPEQHRAYIEEYQKRMRAMRGSPVEVEGK